MLNVKLIQKMWSGVKKIDFFPFGRKFTFLTPDQFFLKNFNIQHPDTRFLDILGHPEHILSIPGDFPTEKKKTIFLTPDQKFFEIFSHPPPCSSKIDIFGQKKIRVFSDPQRPILV